MYHRFGLVSNSAWCKETQEEELGPPILSRIGYWYAVEIKGVCAIKYHVASLKDPEFQLFFRVDRPIGPFGDVQEEPERIRPEPPRGHRPVVSMIRAVAAHHRAQHPVITLDPPGCI